MKKTNFLNKKQKQQKKEINKSDYTKIKKLCSTKRQQNEHRKIQVGEKKDTEIPLHLQCFIAYILEILQWKYGKPGNSNSSH